MCKENSNKYPMNKENCQWKNKPEGKITPSPKERVQITLGKSRSPPTGLTE